MFIGRERELQELNRLFESDRFELPSFYADAGLENRADYAVYS